MALLGPKPVEATDEARLVGNIALVIANRPVVDSPDRAGVPRGGLGADWSDQVDVGAV